MRRALVVLGTLAALCAGAASEASAGVDHLPRTHIDDSRGKLLPLPGRVTGNRDAYVDSRIRADLIWISKLFPRLYVVEGYSGPLPGGGRAGCRGCHVSGSDHKVGLAVDIGPIGWDGRGCDSAWNQVTRLAQLAEPKQGRTRAPFRWVGYDGDAGHGCGNHLHLSWVHATDTKKHHTADWVEVFALRR
jgi:hypothetical protein